MADVAEQTVVLGQPGRLGSFDTTHFSVKALPVAIVASVSEDGLEVRDRFPLPDWVRTVATQNRMCGDTYVCASRADGSGFAHIGPTLGEALANVIQRIQNDAAQSLAA